MAIWTETWPSSESKVQEVTQPIAARAITLNETWKTWQGSLVRREFGSDSEALGNRLFRLNADYAVDELAVFEDE